MAIQRRSTMEQYLMDRSAEIALARSAAPDAISHDASVIVLTRHRYETAVQGKNGWICKNLHHAAGAAVSGQVRHERRQAQIEAVERAPAQLLTPPPQWFRKESDVRMFKISNVPQAEIQNSVF